MSRKAPNGLLSPLPVGSTARQYPYLANLLHGWFHQDFDIDGGTLHEVLANYRNATTEDERKETIADIKNFIAKFGESDELLAKALDTTFKLDVIVEGWEGLTTCQWLEKTILLVAM